MARCAGLLAARLLGSLCASVVNAISVSRSNLQLLPHDLNNLLVRLRRRSARIYDRYPPRLPLRNRGISVMHSCEETSRLLFKTILVVAASRRFRVPFIAPPRPAHAGMRFRVHQNGQIRLQIAAQHAMQIQHCLTPQLPSAALIGLRRIGKAVAQNDRSRSQPRLNDLGNMLGSRSEHQRHFRQWRKPGRPRVEQHFTDLLSRRRSARLSSLDNLMSRLTQHCRELAHLRALPRSVEPFKCDELSASRHAAES